MDGKYNWNRLNHLQVGKYAEYYAMMEFTLYGSEVYSSEVDDRGIDFVVRGSNGRFLEVQVKAARSDRTRYVFFPKSKFDIRPSLFAVVAVFENGKWPDLYLIPSDAWSNPDGILFVDRGYEGLKSKPEYGLNLTRKGLSSLKRFDFEAVVSDVCGEI